MGERDVGFDDPDEIKLAKSYGSVSNYMYYSDDFDYDEGQQAQLEILNELLGELKEE